MMAGQPMSWIRAWRSRLEPWAVLFGVWVLIESLFITRIYVYRSHMGKGFQWHSVIESSLLDSLVWTVLTAVLFQVSWWFPVRRTRWLAPLCVHAALSVVLASLKVASDYWLAVQYPDHFAVPESSTLAFMFVTRFHSHLLFCGVISYIGHALSFRRLYRERLLATTRLEALLAEARLHALRMQLQPHFLFNTLHAISALIQRDPERAERMLARLSDFLRMILEYGQKQVVALKDELAMMQTYVDIEQVRFGPRLSVRTTIEPDALGALVPSLLLQPLVENAIRHGIDSTSRPGRLMISARKTDQSLVLEIADNGQGLNQESGSPREGIGLANTRARLEQLFPSSHYLELSPSEEGGALVRLAIPFHTHGLVAEG